MSKPVEVHNTRKIYSDGTEALKGIDLTLSEGQILGLIGPNGACKSTLVKLVLGLLKPTSGTCRLWGENCYSRSQHNKKKVGFLLEHLGVYDKLTVRENMDFWRRLYEVTRDRIPKLLNQWGLEAKSNDLAKGLSAGMRQKLAIARCLLSDPPLIILDEPTSNLDPEARKGVVELLQGYAGEKTLLITSHDLFDIQRICERIVLLRRGKISIEGTMDQIKDELGTGREVKVRLDKPVPEKLRKDIWEEFKVEIDQGESIVLTDEEIEVKNLVSYLVDHGVDLQRVEEEKVTLEDIYTKIIREDETNETN